MNINKKYIVVIVVVVLAVWIGFFFGKKSAVAPDVSELLVEQNVATTTQTVVPVQKSVTTKTVTSPKAPSAVSMTKSGAYIVSYTNRGFVPSTLSIKRGKSVRFINNSTKSMSITTTDTTNSQMYSELNQSKTVGSGGVYDFTFVNAGVWGYANRNNVADKGTIVVE